MNMLEICREIEEQRTRINGIADCLDAIHVASKKGDSAYGYPDALVYLANRLFDSVATLDNVYLAALKHDNGGVVGGVH